MISKRIYELDINFFETVNIENSYWAGFIAADGSIRKDGKTLEIQLSEKDLDLLTAFKKSIKYGGSIKYRILNNRKQIRLIIKCRKIVEDLYSNFNIINNKSLKLEPPNIQGINALSYIKGYCDGDGSIKINKQNKLIIDFNGTEKLLIWIKNILSEININKIGKVKINKCGSIFRWSLNGKNAEYFGDILKSLDVYNFKRKWNKINTKKVKNLNDFFKGWIFGGFVPSLLINEKFEIAIKKYNKGDFENSHVHKISTEYTVIVEGEVKMNNIIYKENDVILINPGEYTDFNVLSDRCTTCVVKIPSSKNDKY